MSFMVHTSTFICVMSNNSSKLISFSRCLHIPGITGLVWCESRIFIAWEAFGICGKGSQSTAWGIRRGNYFYSLWGASIGAGAISFSSIQCGPVSCEHWAQIGISNKCKKVSAFCNILPFEFGQEQKWLFLTS